MALEGFEPPTPGYLSYFIPKEFLSRCLKIPRSLGGDLLGGLCPNTIRVQCSTKLSYRAVRKQRFLDVQSSFCTEAEFFQHFDGSHNF